MNYVQQVADHFIKLDPDKNVLDSVDYTTIAEWEKQEIPLDLVLNAIREISRDKSNGLHSFDHLVGEVRSRFDMWLGNPSAGTPEDLILCEADT